jgi:hypothetical protein
MDKIYLSHVLSFWGIRQSVVRELLQKHSVGLKLAWIIKDSTSGAHVPALQGTRSWTEAQ